MRKTVIIAAVIVVMMVSIAIAGIVGPIVVSAVLETMAYRCRMKGGRA